MSVGTPGQSVKVAIDTGSDELWVDPDCNSRTITDTQAQECEADGTYDPNNSSTVADLQSTNEITYGTGQVRIQYVTDNVALPESSKSSSLSNQVIDRYSSCHPAINLTSIQFGVAIADADLNEGILGLVFGDGTNLQYKNFVDELSSQNATQSKAFSVALGSNTADNGGVIIFGGVDTKKFTGSLVSNDILAPTANDIQRYTVQLNSVGTTTSGKSKTYDGGSTPIVLDTGSSLSILPSSVVEGMVTDFDAKLDSNSGLYFVDCSVASEDDTIDFAFPGITINVPMSEFIFDAGGGQCVLGTQALDTNSGISALLGDTFLRSAYVVFDQTSNTILMAPYKNCGTNEQTIPSGSGAAAKFSGECGSGSSSTSDDQKNAGSRIGGSANVLGYVVAVMAAMSLFM